MDSKALLATQRALINTTATQGWLLITKELAPRVLAEMERECFKEEDDTKAARLRVEAKAARTFWQRLLQLTDAYSTVDAEEPTTGDEFITF